MTVVKNATDALMLLLSEWADKTFTSENRDVAALNHLWITLAGALCDCNASKMKVFE